MKISILYGRRDKKKIARLKFQSGAVDLAAQTKKDREFARRRSFTFGNEIPLFHDERRITNQRFSSGLDQVGLDIGKIDRLHGLTDMQAPGLPIGADPIPIKYAISGVAILLNLGD